MTSPGFGGGTIYLDYNATTPLDPRVLDAMDPYLRSVFGNPASRHRIGEIAATAVDQARAEVATLLGARDREVVFTSGATESDNLALFGSAVASDRRHIVSASTEHKAVLDTCTALQRRGYEVTLVAPDSAGRISAEAVGAALREDTLLVSVMGANNELGTLSPIADIAAFCRPRGVVLHCDAAQLVGKLPVDVNEMGVDLLSASSHKMYGPKGVGALFVRRGTALSPTMFGGGHEGGLRSGTLNVPAIVGFGAAARVASERMAQDASWCEQLRGLLLDRLRAVFPNLEVNGHDSARLPGTLNVRLPGIDADSVQLATPGIAVSSGSACTSATPEPSHVLRAVGRSWSEAQECIRFSFGRFSTVAEIEDAVELLAAGAARLHGPSLVEQRP
jgi:cysteine desulfurase